MMLVGLRLHLPWRLQWLLLLLLAAAVPAQKLHQRLLRFLEEAAHM